MLLNTLIIGLMALSIVLGTLYFKLTEVINEKKDRRMTKDIWGRV